MLSHNDETSFPRIYRRRLKTISNYPSQCSTPHLKDAIISSTRRKSISGHNRKSLNQVIKTIQPHTSHLHSDLLLYKSKKQAASLGEPLQHFLSQIGKGVKPLETIQEDKVLSNVENSEVYRYYSQFIKGKQISQEIIAPFAAFLHNFHCLFQKHHLILIASLLQIGHIQQYPSNHKVYKYSTPIKQIGIILWGKLVLKKYKSKQKYECHSTQILGEQILLQSVLYSNFIDKCIEKGEILSKQTCKTLSNTGVLFIPFDKFLIMQQQLKKHGFKEVIDRFRSIMLRSYLKKKQFRRTKALIISQ